MTELIVTAVGWPTIVVPWVSAGVLPLVGLGLAALAALWLLSHRHARA